MRRLPYQGDAAKVADVDVGLQRALIRFVPRLDYAELGHKMSAAALNEDGSQSKKKNAQKTTIRPAARSDSYFPLPLVSFSRQFSPFLCCGAVLRNEGSIGQSIFKARGGAAWLAAVLQEQSWRPLGSAWRG